MTPDHRPAGAPTTTCEVRSRGKAAAATRRRLQFDAIDRSPDGADAARDLAPGPGHLHERGLPSALATMSSPTWLLMMLRASGSRPSSVTKVPTSDRATIWLSPTTPHLVWSASTTR